MSSGNPGSIPGKTLFFCWGWGWGWGWGRGVAGVEVVGDARGEVGGEGDGWFLLDGLTTLIDDPWEVHSTQEVTHSTRDELCAD